MNRSGGSLSYLIVPKKEKKKSRTIVRTGGPLSFHNLPGSASQQAAAISVTRFRFSGRSFLRALCPRLWPLSFLFRVVFLPGSIIQ